MNKYHFLFGLSGLLILSAALVFGTANPKEIPDYQANTEIRCKNCEFRSDVLFVTDVDNLLPFQCVVKPKSEIPEGYVPAPTAYQWKVTSGTVEIKENECLWKSPTFGLQEIQVSGTLKFLAPQPKGIFARKQANIEIPFHAALKCLLPVKVDSLSDGKVNGFEVGKYMDPTKVRNLKNPSAPSMIQIHQETYQPPKLFYAVTPETYRLRIFKDYTLGDFDLDPRFLPLTYPRYIAINPRILKKIDLLETIVRNAGVHLTKFRIFYGFRSPAYNLGSREEEGNKNLKSKYSIHMYGLAVDIMIDEDDNLIMDDLNGDGYTSEDDAKKLLQYVNQLDKELTDKGSDLVGGAGPYPHLDFYERGAYAQSPYVHMDARGYMARWVGQDTIGIRKEKDPYALKSPIPPWPW